MYKSKKQKKLNIKFLIIIVVFIIFFGISISVYMSRSNFFGEGFIKDIFNSINKVIMYPFTALNSDKNEDQS